MHQRNLQFLATELFKVLNGLSSDLMKDVFPLNDDSGYSTCNKRTFKSRHVKTVRYGTDSLAYLAPKIWELVPNEMKNLESLTAFKTAIKKWKATNCPFRLFKSIYCRLALSSIISKYEPHKYIVIYASLFVYLRSFFYIHITFKKFVN